MAINIFYYLILICLFFFFILFITRYREINKNNAGNKEELKLDFFLAQKYLDQFYVKNKFYTFSITFIYIFNIIIIFIIIRYMAIGNVIQTSPIEFNYITLLHIIILYIIVIIFISLYMTIMSLLFKKEVIKFHIYLKQFFWWYTVKNYLDFKFFDYIFGSLYIITYRIATLTYKEHMYPIPYNFSEDEIEYGFLIDDDSNYIIYNKKVIHWAYNAKSLSKKYPLVQDAFKLLARIFRYLFYINKNLYKPLPYFIFILIFFIEIYNKELKYIYLVSFILIIIKTKRDLCTFLDTRDLGYEGHLSSYFYKNSKDYKKQRLEFLNEKNLIYDNKVISEENRIIYRSLNNYIDISFNNFIIEPYFNPVDKKIQDYFKRILLCIFFFILGYYLLFKTNLNSNNISIGILLFPLLLMLYFNYKTFRLYDYIEMLPMEEYKYKYSFIHNIFFWIFTFIQTYIFWIFLLKPQLVFLDNDVLWDFIITIKKVYTVEEKIVYLFQYFEYCSSLTESSYMYIDREYLRYIIRQIDYNRLIDENITLKDLQVYINLLLDNQLYIEQHYSMTKQVINYITQEESKQWYILLCNLAGISTLLFGLINIATIIIYMKNIYTVSMSLNIPQTKFMIINPTYVQYFPKIKRIELLWKFYEKFMYIIYNLI